MGGLVVCIEAVWIYAKNERLLNMQKRCDLSKTVKRIKLPEKLPNITKKMRRQLLLADSYKRHMIFDHKDVS